MKVFRLWIFAMVVGLYTTVVLQALWNWFVVPSLTVPEISYWQMFGLIMFLQMLLERDTLADNKRWEHVSQMVYVCVPPERKKEIDDQIETGNETIWFEAGWMVFSRVLSSTATLAVGWMVHVLV